LIKKKTNLFKKQESIVVPGYATVDFQSIKIQNTIEDIGFNGKKKVKGLKRDISVY